MVIAGCSNNVITRTTTENTSTFSLINNQVTKYPYTRKMTKPEMSGMNNRDAMQHGFHDTRKMTYVIPQLDLSDPIYKEQCSSWFELVNADNGKTIKTIPFKDFKSDAKFDVSDQYNGNGLWLEFSQAQKNFLNTHGRTIFKANSWFLQQTIAQTQYQWEGNEVDWWWDERATTYNQIGWDKTPYKRYPYNTILVTSDLLLHVYHRVFDNSLKYYEETTARPMLTKLSQALFEKFITLAKQTPDTQNNHKWDHQQWSTKFDGSYRWASTKSYHK